MNGLTFDSNDVSSQVVWRRYRCSNVISRSSTVSAKSKAKGRSGSTK